MANEFLIKAKIDASNIDDGFKSINSFIAESEKKIEEYDKKLESLGEGNYFTKEYQKISKKRDMLAHQIESLNKMLDVDVSAGKLKEFSDTLDDLNKKGINARNIDKAVNLDNQIKSLEGVKESLERALEEETSYLLKVGGQVNRARASLLDAAGKADAQRNLGGSQKEVERLEGLIKDQERYNELVKKSSTIQRNIGSASLIPGMSSKIPELTAELDAVKEEQRGIEENFSKAGVSLNDNLVSRLKEAKAETEKWQGVLKKSETAGLSLKTLEERMASSNSRVKQFSGELESANKRIAEISAERSALPINEESIKAFNDANRGAELWKEMLQEDTVALMRVGKEAASLTKEVEKQEASEIKAAQAAEDRARRIEITNNREARAAEESAQRIDLANKKEARAVEESAQRLEAAKNKDLRAQEMHEASLAALNSKEVRAAEKHAADLDKVNAQTQAIRDNNDRKREESQSKLERANSREEREQEKHIAKMEKLAADTANVESSIASREARDKRSEEAHSSRMALNSQSYEINAQREADRQIVFQQRQQDRVKKNISGIGRSISSMAKSVVTPIINMGASVLKWVGRTAVTATKTLIHTLKSLATVAKNVSGKLITLFGHASIKGIKALSKGVGTLSKGFFEVSKSLLGLNLLKSIGSSIGGFVNRVLRLASLAFVFRVITQGFRQLKNDVVNAFGTYLNYDSALNSSVNTLKAQLTTLKAQLASAFSPIISLIVPALSTLVGWCVSAANGISALIASLTGRTSWKKAVVNSVGSVGDAASGAADDLGDAADAADELKEKLGNYDKLNVIGDEDSSKAGKSSGGKGAGGGAGTGADISYVDQSIGDDIKNLADWLKEMWDKADFSELGRAVGEYLLKGLQSIPWKKIQKQAEKVAKSITSFLRGFLTTPGLAKELGRSFGELINTGIIFAKTFVQTFPFSELGKFLSEALNSSIKTINFHDAGVTIRDGVNGILKTWKELVDPNTGADLALLGDKVADFVKTALDVDWDLLRQNFENTGVKFGEFINALAQEGTLTSIGAAIDSFIEGLTAGFISLTNTVDFTTLGEDIGGAIKEIGNSLSNSLTEIANVDIGAKLSELMAGIRAKVTPEDFLTWGISLGAALGTALAGLVDTIYENRDYIYESVRNFIGGIVEGASGKLTEGKFTEIGNTLTTWMSNAISDVSNWLLVEDNQEQLKGNLKAFLNGAADGWKPGTGGKLGKAIKAGLNVIFDTIKEWCSDEDNIKKAGDEVKGFLDGLLGNGDGNLTVDDFATLGDNLRSLGEDVVDKITKWINDPNGLQQVLKDLETFCDSLFGDQDGVLTMNDVTSFLSKVYGWLKDNVGTIFQASPVIAKLALFFLALKSGFAGQLLKIGLKAAGSFGSGLLKQLGMELTKSKIEGAVGETTLKGVGTSWGDVLGIAMGAAIAIKIGNAIRKELETYEWDNGGFFANSRNKSVMGDDRLSDWQKQIYKAMWDSGLWEDSPVFDLSQLDLKNVLASLDDVDLDLPAIKELQDTILKLDPSKVEEVRNKLVNLRDTGIVPVGTASDNLTILINGLTGTLNDQNAALTRYSGSMSKSATDSDKARVSYYDLKDAIKYLGDEAGLDKSVVDQLNTIVEASAFDAQSMGTAYDLVVGQLQNSSKAGQEWANVLQHKVHEQLNKLDDIKVSDLTSKVDEFAKKWGLTGGEIEKVKGKINEFPKDGKKAFAGLIEGLAESKNGATGLKDVIASQLGIEVDKLGENSEIVRGLLNELFNPSNTEEGQAKVNKILQAIGLDIDKVNDKDAKVTVEAETEEADGKLDTTKNKTEELDGKEADITANVESTDAEETFVALDTSVNELDGSTISIKGDAEDLRTMLEASAVDISAFEGTNGTVIVDFEGNKWSFDTTEEAVKGVIAEYQNKTVTTDFVGEDNVSEGAKSAEETANTVSDEKVITFKGDDQVSSEAGTINTNLSEMPSEKQISFVNVGGLLLSTFITGVLGLALAALPKEKTITFKVNDQTTEPLNTIKTAITGVTQHSSTQLDVIKGYVTSALNVIKTSTTNALTGGSGSIQSTVNTLSNSVKSSCSNMASSFSAYFNKARDAAVGALTIIQQRINSLHGKSVVINIEERGYSLVMRAINSIPDYKTVTVYIEWSGITDMGLSASVTVDWQTVYRALGGVFKNGRWSDLPQMAKGGIFSNGFWRNIPAYASGTAKAHGTMFVAGEAGPEVVGHIGGRTEVLNKSQIASAIYSAVSSAMSNVLTAAANAIIQTLVNAANSVNYNLSALSNEYKQSRLYTQDLAFAIEGFGDVGALKSFYSTSYAPATNVDRLADEVARRISGNFYINNQMTLDGRVVYDEMVAIDRTNVRLTGKSGFGG